MKTTGGRYGMHSGSGKFKNVEVVGRLNVAGNEMPIMPMNGDVFYVDKTITASGDGKSWKFAFKTATEGLAALGDYDTLIIGPGNYDEAAKMTLTGVKGVKILGHGTGFQWNEGSTCIRDVTSSDDLLDITGCQGIEIAGISFINTAAKDAINFTGLNYSTHIHDCCFVGDVGAGEVQDYGVNTGSSNGPDTYIHDCLFFHQDVAGIEAGGYIQRFTCHDCVFIVPDASIGINIGAGAASYNRIWRCYFMGSVGDKADQGIDIAASSNDGRLLIADCRFAGCTMTGGGTGAEVAVTECYLGSATGGAIFDPT